VLRLVAAGILGSDPSAQPLHRQVAVAWTPGSRDAEELLRRALVLLADHELNASAYTVRCAASTGITLYDAAVAGLVALKGPAHGGAGPLAAHMLAGLAAGDLAARVRERVALGEAFHGFGHPLYPQGDPRAADLLAALAAKGLGGEMTRRLPALVAEATGLRPNIDYALAVLMRALGLPAGHEIALFAVARSAGWIAHALEQLADGRLIRPRARYTGPPPGRPAAR
jgi:citrate synthase